MQDIAGVAEMTPGEVRLRLMGPMPRVLRMDADVNKLGSIAHVLNGMGLHTGVCDPRLAPTDRERLLARWIEPMVGSTAVRGQAEGLKIRENDISSEVCPYPAIELIQRGNRVHSEVVSKTTSVKKFSAGRAIMTGGMSMKKKVDMVEHQHVHKAERFIVIHRNDGGRDI